MKQNEGLPGEGSVQEPRTEEAEAFEATKVRPSARMRRKARKAARKQRRADKKMARKQRRAMRRAAFQALPAGRKLLRCLIWIVAILAALALLGFGGYKGLEAIMVQYYTNKAEESLVATASREDILAFAPEDKAGEARVAATAAFPADDTWVIYMYLCGSDLESLGRSEMSDVAKYYISRENEDYSTKQRARRQGWFHAFVEDMERQGMALPSSLFLPDGREYGGESGEQSAEVGYASKNLQDLLSVELPENISVVLQTGGATYWSNPRINPNASQRFLFNSDGLTELSSMYPQNMGSGRTLADFLRFCKEEYPADHEMLLCWDHGGGPFGFSSDEMYSYDTITLPELSGALSAVYGKNPDEPPFELVGFDACLMASAEVTEALRGYTRYLTASEELEAGDGWPYAKWLGALAENPGMNGAQLGKVIADCFVEHNANYSVNMKWLQSESVATFSVVDVEKAHAVYEAYTELAAAALRDTAGDPSPLAAMGRAASQSIRYGGSVYKQINTLDLGCFMENLSGDYPDETAAVLRALDDAVLYHRETSYTLGSKGLSIYFPTDVDSIGGLIYYLEYLNEVCTDPSIKSLYYYKIAGCLSEELQAYANAMGYGAFGTLDVAPLKQIANEALFIDENNSVELPIGNEAAALIQGMYISVAKFDADTNEIRFLGEDTSLHLDEYRTLHTDFNGEWVMLEGQPLYLEMIDQTDSYIRYRSPVKYNGSENAYLVLAYDCASGEFSILGVQTMQEEADTVGRNLDPVEIGDSFAVCYRIEEMDTQTIYETYGNDFTFEHDSKVENAALEDGEYYLLIALKDTRGDEYYAAPVSFSMRDGAIENMAVDDSIMATQSIE